MSIYVMLRGRRGDNMYDLITLQKQLKSGSFKIYFYPQYEVTTSKIIGAETCVKYKDNNEWIDYKNFSAELEKNNLISAFDIWVLDVVCQLQKQRAGSQRFLIPIIVNLSAWTVSNPYNVYDIALILKKYNLPPNSVQAALTTATPFAITEGLQKGMQFLQHQGIKIMLNDFGTGFATLSLFTGFEFDKLKIDKRVLGNAARSTRLTRILTCVIELAREMRVIPICDGVDSLEDYRLIKEINCPYAQGAFYSVPLTQEEFYNIQKEMGL